ncbi:hypothetical protein AVEN_220643-1, partial [Araneus ventricosus]
ISLSNDFFAPNTQWKQFCTKHDLEQSGGSLSVSDSTRRPVLGVDAGEAAKAHSTFENSHFPRISRR